MHPTNLISASQIPGEIAKSADHILNSVSRDDPFRAFYFQMALPQESRPAQYEAMRTQMVEAMRPANAISKALREQSRNIQRFPTTSQLAADGKIDPRDIAKGRGALAKAQLDVGTLTNLANVTGGQTLGYISLDTHMARGTVRPNSFTLYQHLNKTGAYQVVDYWPYVFDTGAGLPGTAFNGFSNVSSGTLSTSAGQYELQFINLKLAVNGRSITTALAAQNSFVDIQAQENVNAALTILESVNWACYYGNPTIFTNQFQGIDSQIPAANVFDFQQFYNSYAAAQGWSNSQALFNLIYEASSQITSFRTYGRITHAFMTPVTAGALQGLVTTLLNNVVTNITSFQDQGRGIIVDGDLQGMRTRFGEIQFPIDLYISARNKPAQAILLDNGTNMSSTVPGAPALVSFAVISAATIAASAVPATSYWTATYTATGAASGTYSYAVAACDINMNESKLAYVGANGSTSGFIASGIAAGGAYQLTISGAVGDLTTTVAYRVYRSGLTYTPTSTATVNPAAYRLIGTVAVSGAVASGATPFTDYNQKIPGSEDIFLLDLDEQDNALDFRYLLPLTKIELFAQNLFMPWAVAMIGAIRLRVPKFHGTNSMISLGGIQIL